MVEDKPENIEPSPDSGRAKRPPPTIDLEASEVSDQAPDISADAEPKRSSQWFWRGAISSAVIAALCGACAAALVIGVIWLLAWSPGMTPSAPAEPNINAAAIDDLTARITSIESKANKAVAPTPDPAVAARLDEVEKAVGAMRGEIAGLRVQSEKLASAINDIKSAPRESAVSPDLAEINERIAGIERATRAQSAEIAQENSKSADDVPLRRVVTAALLESVVRTGDPYAAALAAAKPLAPDPNLLKPLEKFAASGVPSPAVLSRELLALIPKLSPPTPQIPAAGSSMLQRLEAGAAKLVRIERTDAVGNERGNIVARVTAAALRNDYSEARRELNALTPADRAAAQGWIEKADGRDAALAASRQFAAEAMATLAKPAR
jgi:hypothetical protein